MITEEISTLGCLKQICYEAITSKKSATACGDDHTIVNLYLPKFQFFWRGIILMLYTLYVNEHKIIKS